MAAEDSSGGLSSAFTDLMTSLAVIFILLLVASVNNKQQELRAARQEIEATKLQLMQSQQATEDTRQEIREKLRDELALMMLERGVKVKIDKKDPLGLLVVIPEGLLQFRVDRWDIPPAGQEFLDAFIPPLARGACAFRDDLSSIVVEGHADSTGTDEHNLKLSQDRSLEVVRQSLAVLPNGDGGRDTRGCFLDLVSASGRGNRDPFRVNGVEDRDRSRRVVFKIRVRSFEQRVPRLLMGIRREEASDAS